MALRVVVDENAGPGKPIWEQFQVSFSNQAVDYLFLKEAHPGIPDVEILDKLLGPSTILLTGDCALHMQVLKKGLRSYTVDGTGKLTNQRLPGVMISPLPRSAYKELLSDYRHVATSDLPERLKNGLTEKQFKRYRTARRRIRSHFGSAAAISHLSITIGERPTKKGLLCGFVFNVSAYSDIPRLRASEGYCLPVDQSADSAYAVIHALRDQYMLQLEQIPTELYIISPKSLALCRTLLAGEESTDPMHQSLGKLLLGLSDVKLQPCTKGLFFDSMQLKLEQLSRGRNEVTNVDFEQIAANLRSESEEEDADDIDDSDEEWDEEE